MFEIIKLLQNLSLAWLLIIDFSQLFCQEAHFILLRESDVIYERPTMHRIFNILSQIYIQF